MSTLSKPMFMKFLLPLLRRLAERSCRWRSVWAATLILAAACSSSDDSSEDLYAVVQAASFTFNETDPSLNTVQVLANTAWQVYWLPETSGVSVEPASGSGNAAFRILDMPAGTTLRFGVRPVSGTTASLFATVTRAATSEVAALKVSPETLTFDPAGTNRISVTSDTSWSVTGSDPGLAFSPAGGTGNGTITVTAAPVGTSTLTVTAGEGSAASKATVTISRAADISGETVFSLDFGAAPSSAAFADSFTSWQTQTGSGAGSVSYASYGVKIRSGYDGASAGASGKGYATMTATRTTNYFTVKNISLPDGVQDFTLSFYAAFATGDVVLSVSDGTSSRSLAYQASASYNVWSKVTVGFTLANPVSNLTIQLAPSQAFDYNDRQYGLNFDDIVLTTGGGGQQVDFGTAPSGGEYRWPELPATPDDMTNKKIHTYWASTVTSKQYLRNYTYCYDTYRHCPLWIAHPQHACYEEGSGRTDVWKKDEFMTDAEQAIIYPLPEVNGNRALSLYTESLNRQWTRGHMLMSNYRGGTDTELNAQTFYSSNIAPQGGDAFDKLWGAAEIRIQDYYVCADTLYCVSGAYFENDNLTARDASGWNTTDGGQVRYYVPGYSKVCVIPTHFYKLILRTRSGNTGKAIQECKASELKAVGFWFEHADRINGSSSPMLNASYMKSVEWIEQKTGFTFFPEVPDEVKQQCNPADWGF